MEKTGFSCEHKAFIYVVSCYGPESVGSLISLRECLPPHISSNTLRILKPIPYAPLVKGGEAELYPSEWKEEYILHLQMHA